MIKKLPPIIKGKTPLRKILYIDITLECKHSLSVFSSPDGYDFGTHIHCPSCDPRIMAEITKHAIALGKLKKKL